MDSNEVAVSAPDAWPAATDVHTSFTLDTLSGVPLTFNLRAMSHGELLALETQLPIPEAPVVRTLRDGTEVRDEDSMAYQEQLAELHFSRWVMWIDKCWKPLPGATQTEKVKWVEANLWRNGELTALFNRLRKLSGLGTGTPCLSVTQTAQEADPENWAKASQAARFAYKIPHPDKVLVFDLAGLSQLRVNQIRDTCRPPEPPMMPEIHKVTRKPIPGTDRPDYTDPGYQQALKAAVFYENCMLLEAALFAFPGGTKEEKLAWLDQRPAYEVGALLAALGRRDIKDAGIRPVPMVGIGVAGK